MLLARLTQKFAHQFGFSLNLHYLCNRIAHTVIIKWILRYDAKDG